ncbi:MAG: hypothetical protein AAF809_00570 [Bacteroidota bacterium]
MTTPDYRAMLAARLGLDVPEDWRQDWAWEVADYDRLNDYHALYTSAAVLDGEREHLMEMMLQAIADLGHASQTLPDAWQPVASLLRARPDLHADTIAYWTQFEAPHTWAFVGTAVRALR